MAKAVCRPLAAVATALLLVGGAVSALAQNSPVGSWDMVLSGHESGVAQITFNNDFTLDGVEILTSRARKSVSEASLDPRNPSVNTGRNVSTNGSVSTNFYGKANLSGMWGFDSGGHVIGILNESGGIVTNGVSFRAVVRPGVRITVSGVRFEGRVLYRGVPLNALPDISGNYYDTGTRNGMVFNELFTLTPAAGPNSYDAVGVGPAYSLQGSVIVSAQKRIGFFAITDETTNGVLQAVTGPFNPTTGKGTLIGLSEFPSLSGGPALSLSKRVGK